MIYLKIELEIVLFPAILFNVCYLYTKQTGTCGVVSVSNNDDEDKDEKMKRKWWIHFIKEKSQIQNSRKKTLFTL